MDPLALVSSGGGTTAETLAVNSQLVTSRKTLAVGSQPLSRASRVVTSSGRKQKISDPIASTCATSGIDIVYANWTQDTRDMYVGVEVPEGTFWLTIPGFVSNQPLQCFDGYCEYHAPIEPRGNGQDPHKVKVIVHSLHGSCQVGIH